MRSILLFACLLLQAIVFAQGNQAVLQQCAGAGFDFACTRKFIEDGIKSRITSDVINELKAAGAAYFTVSTVFVTDDKGGVIPDETDVLSESKTFENAVLDYINNRLPAFTPGNGPGVKRSLHMHNLYFLYNTASNDFQEAKLEELLKRNISPATIAPDKPIAYPGCEGGTAAEIELCTRSKLYKFITDKYRVPRSDVTGQVKCWAKFIIRTDGKMVIQEIYGGGSIFRKELQRILEKLPDIEPAEFRGIPINTHYTLPVTINVR